MNRLLAGVRILDLSRVLAGPWATQLMADMGATVIKVERPQEGDDTRKWGPPWLHRNDVQTSAYYLCANRGKLALAADFASSEGQELVRTLAAGSDVVVENFKVGVLKRYGLDAESLRSLNPRLVYCSVTGFGQDGPYSGRPGYDFIAQGMGGLMSVTGSAESGPMKTGVALSDIMTGLYATAAILAALFKQGRTGSGCHLDVSLLDVTVATLANQAFNYFATGQNPPRYGNAHPNIVPYQSFLAADRGINLAIGNDSQFRRLCEAVGRPYLAEDPRFATNGSRAAHKSALECELVPLFAAASADTWIERLDAAGVPAGPINEIADVFADPHVRHRGMKVELQHEQLGDLPGVASPIMIDGKRAVASSAPPMLGENTDEILARDLGLNSGQIAALRARGIVG
jgi:crotonobetainyl-CoA:carnitine CoA-transferase CaiB-like acyl-CoA transferase